MQFKSCAGLRDLKSGFQKKKKRSRQLGSTGIPPSGITKPEKENIVVVIAIGGLIFTS